MVKGGTKRKSDMKKITNKASRATTFTKRREGLYSKAAQLCVISDAQIAILATPSSSNSNASFFSFGHSSVDSVVSAYLSGKRLRPVSLSGDTKATREDLGLCMARKDLGLGFWWNDEKLVNSKNRQELMEAMQSMEVLISRLKALEDQTLTITKVEEEDKVEISPELDEWSEMELNKLLQDCDDDKEEEEDQNVSEKTCNNNFVSLPETTGRSLEEEAMYIDWDTINACFASNCDEEFNDDVPPPPPVVSNTEEEEDQNASEKTCNNNDSVSSLPAAAAERSLQEATMDLDMGTIFEGLLPYDEAELFWSDQLLIL